MNIATKKWIFLKIASAILIPLMLWFILNFISIYDKDYLEVVNFFSNQLSKFLFSIFIIFAYFFSALSISEVFEDYITDHKLKNVANKLLYASAIIIPILTIFIIFNLN
jgi:succinate dehydrogenase / fumarate reductase membrane anchor subunit